MSKISFQDSFHSKSGLFQVAEVKLKSEGFINSTKQGRKLEKELSKITPEITFLSNDVKRSKSLHDYLFTNYLNSRTIQDIKTAIFDIFMNPNLIDTPYADYVRLSDPKILECIKLYLDPIPSNPQFVKTSLVDGVGNKRPVRVYCLMELVQNPLKAVYKIVLIDPFHLVIPSEKDGKRKEVVERENYESNRNNNICMLDYMRSI